VPLPWKAWKTQGGKGREKGKETLANLEGNPETATLLQQAITAKQEPSSTPEGAMSLLD